MISVIITAYKEPKTIGKAIEQVLANGMKDYEVLVVAPDKETLDEAKKYSQKNKRIKIVCDKGNGKPSALNLAVSKSHGEILILTDGDVYMGKDSIKFLLEPLKDEKIGAVSGHPVSQDSKENKFGYWAYLLTEIANKRRIKAIALGKRFFCSGYLFAIRKKLFPELNAELLSEDGFISHKVYTKGYKIEYSEKAFVFVKYPNNFADWIKQKKRSAGGYNQIKNWLGIEMRSFRKESFGGFSFLKYVKNFEQFFWLINLFLSRIYLWFLIYKDINLKKKSREEIWERVESTK